MKKLLALLAFLAIGPAFGQSAGWPPPAGAVAFLGVYNSAAPTLTTGQIGFAQLDASGNLNVNVKAGSGSGCAGTVGTPCVVAGTAGSGSALAGAPVRIGLSDGTNAQNWLAAIALGDAVNGNNTGAVAAWAWNGTTYDRLQVDASKYLKVNCSAGCAGGSFNNNADGVATSSTNGQTASWPYLWNGASWDRQYGDKTNGAWVNVKTSVLPTGAATSALQSTINTTLGSPFQAGGNIGNTSFASTIADGASVTLGAKADAKSTATDTTAVTIMQVMKEISAMEQAPASRAVTNVGTFAVQAAQGAAGSANWLTKIMDAAGNARGANVNSSNQLSVSCDNGCSASSSITGWAGGTLGAMANYGTSPGAVLVPGINAYVTNTNANGSAVSASSAPVVIASDQAAVAVKAASGALASGSIASGAVASGAISSGAIASGAFAAGSFVNATAADPCMFQAKTNVPISTASGTVALVTGVSAKKIYVCSLSLVISTPAVSVSLAEGSSSTCGTSNQAAVIGVATSGTAANGIPLAVNGGLTLGNGGGTVAATATAANYLCLFQSGTTQMAGNLTYVQQ